MGEKGRVMKPEKEFAGIRVERDTWVKLKVVAAIKERSLADLANELIREGLKRYTDEIEHLMQA